MKKVIMIIVIIGVCVGVGFLGWMIFNKKNITAVEIDGEMQTLYLANTNEVNSPNFQDANLKVTYKGGTIKYIPLSEANIEVADFSTSSEKTDGTMKINYKTHVIEVKYVVIKNGYYYVSKTDNYSLGELQSSKSNDLAGTTEFFNLAQDGTLQYYQLNSGKWLLYDGKYLSDYKFDIKGNAINVYLGEETPSYMITAYSTTNGELVVSGRRSNYKTVITNDVETQMETTRVIKELKYVNSLSTNEVEKSELVYNSSEYNTTDGYLKFYCNEKLADRRGEVLLKVTYKKPFVSSMLNEIYVVADNSMITVPADFDTLVVTDFNHKVDIWYASQKFVMTFRVATRPVAE